MHVESYMPFSSQRQTAIRFLCGFCEFRVDRRDAKKKDDHTVNAETAEHAEFVFSGLSEFSRVLR